MAKLRKWTIDDLERELPKCRSYRQLLSRLGLIPAGGNYEQIQKYIKQNKLSTAHFLGVRWSKGMKLGQRPRIELKKILVKGSTYQSWKLKRRLFHDGLKKQKCELCGWAKRSIDGRLPLELDHINGVKTDQRLENLRILCPNCHSLQVTHRGRNVKSMKHT